MFERLSRYSRILVTGPQRSGTTIAARIIAHDTGLKYIDEQAFRATDYNLWKGTVRRAECMVIQCPGMMRYVHEYGRAPDVMIIVMVRPLADIVASQERIDWTHEAFEQARYGQEWQQPTIAETKYNYWREVQQDQCCNFYMVEYDSLSYHPLWIDKAQRARFHSRQWRLG